MFLAGDGRVPDRLEEKTLLPPSRRALARARALPMCPPMRTLGLLVAALLLAACSSHDDRLASLAGREALPPPVVRRVRAPRVPGAESVKALFTPRSVEVACTGPG